MLKKILTLLISLSVVLSVFPCNIQAASEDSNKQEVLEALNIIEGKLPSKVTHNDFVTALTNIVSSDVKISTKDFAKNYGLVGEGETYDGKAAITVGYAVKYAVIVAGYSIEAQDKSLKSYMNVAAKLGLLDGIRLDPTSALTGDGALSLLMNLLEVNPLVWNYSNAYEVQGEEDMLGMYRDIYYHKGVVTANKYTAINNANGLREEKIQVDGEDFYIAVPYDEDILGKWVEVYVQEDKDEDPTIIYVGTLDSRNNILEIEAKDIYSVATDFSKIEYYVNGGNKIKKANLGENLKVIYNGEFYGEYTVEDLKPNVGKIELLNNDGDNTYEIIKVTSYQTMIVDNVNTTDKIITSKYEFDGCLNNISLEDDDIIYSIIKDDEEISLSKISTGDVLSIARTKSETDVRYKICVSSETEESVFNRIIPNDDEIITGIGTYKQTEEFKKQLAYKNESLELGETYTFYFDIFGNIVYAKKVSDNNYCLLYRIYIDRNQDDAVCMEYLTLNNEWKTQKLRKKVNYNDISTVAEGVLNAFSGEDPQIVKIKTNTKDEIIAITLPRETGEYKEHIFTKTPSASYECRGGSHFDNKIFTTATTKVFVMPEPFTKNKDDYYVKNARSFFKGDTTYTISAYDIDNFGLTELITIRENANLQQSNMGRGYFLVTKLTQVLSTDEEACTRIEGSGNGFRNMIFLTNKAEVIENVREGDVINFALDKFGMISAVRNVASLSSDFTEENQTWLYTPYTSMRGTIEDIDHEKGLIKLNCAGAGTTFFLSKSMPCMQYDKNENECDLISTRQLQKGDKVMVRVSYCSLQELIKIEE